MLFAIEDSEEEIDENEENQEAEISEEVVSDEESDQDAEANDVRLNFLEIWIRCSFLNLKKFFFKERGGIW